MDYQSSSSDVQFVPNHYFNTLVNKIEYISRCLDLDIPEWASPIKVGGRDDFIKFRRRRAGRYLAGLCEYCSEEQAARFIWDGRSEGARGLAEFWQEYIHDEKKRDAHYELKWVRGELRESGLSKLTAEEAGELERYWDCGDQKYFNE